MITIHHLNNSRSQRILWMLEEIGVEYEIKHYQRDTSSNLAPPELKEVHPLGKSPVITDGDLTIAETGNIIDYLSRKYARNFMPDENTTAYRQYSYWLHYAEGSLMPNLVMKLIFDKIKTSPMPFFAKPIAKGIANNVMSSYVQPNIDSNLQFVNEHLVNNEWFCGDEMTGADIQMSFPLEAVTARGSASNYPDIEAYVKKFQSRPAYQAALEKGGTYDYA